MANKNFKVRHGLNVAGAVTINAASANIALDFVSTGAIKVPSGNTAQRPSAVSNGAIRYNSQTVSFEGYANNTWGDIGGGLKVYDVANTQIFP